MTPILKVITEYCVKLIKDPRIKEIAEADKPLFARQMWGYLLPAIPEFNIPAEMPEFLMGTPENPKIVEPLYGDYRYTTEEEITSNLIIQLGDSGKGYELFCCRMVTYDDFENWILVPTNATYDSENGTVTLYATPDNPIPKGTIFDMDFYKDGHFAETLNITEMKILALSFQVEWQRREFNNDYISNIPKVEDKSFYEQNRANKEKADDSRLAQYRVELAEEMRRYEQNLAYKKMFPMRRFR